MNDGIPAEPAPTVEGAIHRIGNNEIQVARHGDVEVLAIRGSQEASLVQALETIAGRCSHDVGLDFRELRDMSPTILPMLRRLNRRFEEKGRVLLLYDPPSRLLDLLTLSGASEDFHIYHATHGLSKKQVFTADASVPLHANVDGASDTIVRFTQDLQRSQQLESSLEVAGMRAGRMIRKAQPHFAGYQIAAAYLPHDMVGGDFFHMLPLDDNHLGIVIGDVSGHGIEAALLMGMTRKVIEIRALDNPHHDPVSTLVRANQDLFADLDRFTFVTAFYGILQRDSGNFRYGRAGHNYPLHLSQSQRVARQLPGGGIAFGIDGGPLFESALQAQQALVAPGDALVLYTDGLIEAAHPQRGQYGLERLVDFTERLSPELPPEEMKDAILAEVEEFLEGTPLTDDLSLICIRRDAR
ncbi:MAG: SpoIIE family protein phosphatase [Planctomycetota bacterium]